MQLLQQSKILVFLLNKIKILAVLGCRKLTYYLDNEPKINTLSEELTTKISSKTLRSSYLFGFNGKENDNEVQGEGNSIDFGGRIYDSRLGRWLSLDPLHRKYPSLSPYHFCSNNPILFVDFDGNDFGIEIVGNTIIIKAVYYVGDKQTKDAMTEATNFINNQSDKYQFVTKDGKTYNIQFQLEVKELKNDEAASEEASKDNTANYARITGFPVKYGFTKNGVPQIILGMCEFGGDFIQLSDGTGASDDQKSKILSGMNCTFEEYMKSSILEEVLHSLGVSHEGMEKFSEFDLANFGENAIKGILRQASANDNSLKLKVKGSKGYSQSDKKLKDEDKVKSKTTSSEKGKMKGKVVPSKTSKS
jgi:RHS repeat-associated protein